MRAVVAVAAAFALAASAGAFVLAACSTTETSPLPGEDASFFEAATEAGGMDATPAEGSAVDAPGAEAAAVDGGAGVAFCDQTYGAVRVAFEGCCTSGDTTTDQYKFIDAIYAALTSDCEARLSSAIAKGRVTFDPVAAQACVASFQQTIAAGVCWGNIDTNQSGPAEYGSSACSDVVTGLQAAGKPCAIDLECVSGLTCVGWTGSTDGTCTTPGAAGKPCEQAADAGSALYIDYGFGSHPSCAAGAYCVAQKCQAQAASGAACTEDAECMTGMICHLGHCAAAGPSADGGACDTKVDCVQGFYCALGDGGATPGICLPREGQGGGCTTSGDQCKGICVSADGGLGGVCTAVCGSG
ncbi:MAG TPA: Dickkopf N-terminal cysteine-rich domain-containing protein [Polyangiaceae bacterium]|jgi:hypothetical protein